MTDRTALSEELSELIETRLRDGLSNEQFNGLVDAIDRMRRSQRELARELAAGDLPGRELYLVRLNTLLRKFADEALALIGDRSFRAIFGDAGFQPEQMIDRKAFLQGNRVR